MTLDPEMARDPAHFVHQVTQNGIFVFRILVWMVQSEQTPETIKAYLDACDPTVVRRKINNGFNTSRKLLIPLLFFAVERGSEKVIRTLVTAGANLACNSWPYCIPLLGFTIIHSATDKIDVTNMFNLLLSMGADPNQIPPDMWMENFMAVPRKNAQLTHGLSSIFARWCVSSLRKVVAEHFNLSQRYACYQASQTRPVSGRTKQAAAFYKSSNLLNVHSELVGQRLATGSLRGQVISHLVLESTKPLVLIFTGPSGHGKTELARSMGRLLECDFVHVDCTQMKYETDLFGPKAPYEGHEEGSLLNNHLAKNNGQRNIVFLDEFEKTTPAVWQTFLLPMDTGKYHDRRNGKELDSRKTIFICATNHAEAIIEEFYAENSPIGSSTPRGAAYDQFTDDLRNSFKSKLGCPLVGRVDAIIPFVPFSTDEQAVITHSFLLKGIRKARQPVDPVEGPLFGDIHLHIEDDGALCQALASRDFDSELGARSLERSITRNVLSPLVNLYLEGDEAIAAVQPKNRFRRQCSVRVESDDTGYERIIVCNTGSIELQSEKFEWTEQLFLDPRSDPIQSGVEPAITLSHGRYCD